MKIDFFVCSKPLQYFNARNVPKTFHPNHRRVLILVSNFYKADDFYTLVKKNDCSWSKIVKVSNVRSLYCYLLFHRFHSLFYGYDTSTVLGLIHLVKKYEFYILEEGMSTYYPLAGFGGRKNVIQDYLDGLSGVSTHWGHTRFVKGAYVYYPELYKKLRTPHFEPSIFEKPFVDKVSEDVQLFLTLSNVKKESDEFLNIHNSKVLLYITGWQINQSIIERMLHEKDNYDISVIKPHPHIRDFSPIENTGLSIFKSNLMVEFILCLWMNQGNEITVYHEGSTALFYYRGMVVDEDLSPQRDDMYHQLIKGGDVNSN